MYSKIMPNTRGVLARIYVPDLDADIPLYQALDGSDRKTHRLAGAPFHRRPQEPTSTNRSNERQVRPVLTSAVPAHFCWLTLQRGCEYFCSADDF